MTIGVDEIARFDLRKFIIIHTRDVGVGRLAGDIAAMQAGRANNARTQQTCK